MKAHIKNRIVIDEVKEFVDPRTGELVELPIIKTVPYVANSREEFYLVYASFIGLIVENTFEKAEIQVYAYLLQYYGAGKPFALIKSIKEDIAKITNLKVGTIDNVLQTLRTKPENPVLFRTAKSTYVLNPRYAFQGNSTDRTKAMKIIFELGCKNC